MSWTSILKSLLPVCFFSVFAVSSVESYTCANSECINGMCVSIPDVCETSQACFSQVQELLAPARSSNITAQQKGCSTDVCTDLAFSATLGNEQTFKFDHRCCQTEQCNQGDLHPSPPPSEPNGVQCLACYAEAGGLCIPTPLKCTGAETKCVLAFGSAASDTTTQLVMVGMGCATETACTPNMEVLNGVNLRTLCMEGFPVSKPLSTSTPSTSSRVTTSGSPPLTTFSSVLTGLLLLKVLL